MARKAPKPVQGMSRSDPWRVDPGRLRAARNKAGHTQLSLAVVAGTSPRVISQLEAGMPLAVTLPTVGGLCDALGVSVEHLCGRRPPQTPGK